jgi:hypothetical protein
MVLTKNTPKPLFYGKKQYPIFMKLFRHEMKLFFVIIFTFIGLQLFSQETEHFLVTGKVYDSDTHAALQFVSLTLQDVDSKEIIGDISSKTGEFELYVPQGKYNFIAESLSFKPFKIDLLNIQQDVELGIIELSQNIEELEEIEVIAKDKLVDFKYDRKVYNASKDIANVGGNAVTVLENTPTVRVDEQGKISVRGSAVTVLVDGKPYGGQNSNADVLSLIPSNSISKVELITHSAKYDGQGGDIVNIILKKRRSDGYNGTVEVHGGIPDNDGVSTFLNFKNEKVNVFSTASFNHLVRKKDTKIDQIFLDDNQIPTGSFNEARWDNQQKNNLLFSVGADLNLNEKNSITTSLLFSDSNMNYNADLNLFDYKPLEVLTNSSLRKVGDNTDGTNIEGYIDYTTKFKKENHQLSLFIKYDRNIADNKTNILQTESFPNTESTIQQSLQNQDLHAYTFKLDYKKPLKNEALLELGSEISCRTYANDFIMGEYNDVTLTFDEISSLSSDVTYDENIYDFYVNYNKTFSKLSLSIGLRTEFSNITLGNEMKSQEYDNYYTNYLPSVILGYTFDNNSTLSASYTPYIDRPSIAQLNPFNTFVDERYQRVGNPYLQPSTSHYFLVEYNKDFEKIYFNTALYYVNTDNIILNVLEKSEDLTIDGFPIFKQLPQNNGTMDFIGLEFDITYTPNNKLRLNTFIGPYYNALSNSIDNIYDFNDMVFYGTFTAMYRITNTARFQANYQYQTAKKTAINELGNIQYLNVAMSKDFFEGKSTLTFKINDVFHTREAAYKSLEANTISARNVLFDTQYLLSFSYRFNKASKRNANNRAKDVDVNVFELEEKMQ